MFKKYQHVVRLKDEETEGLLNGEVYAFTKLDGTNASIWNENGTLHLGSRRREVIEGDDNRGFFSEFHHDERFIRFFQKYPHVRLFGEFLVPHSVKSYHQDAWRKFYVFDVVRDIEGIPEDSHLERFQYIPYEEYKEMLEEFHIDYIPLIQKLENPTQDEVYQLLDKSTFLSNIPGEGIVLKNYQFTNCYGRTQWGKIVKEEFLHKKRRDRKKKSDECYDETINKIINQFATEAFIQKEYNKLNEYYQNQGINSNSYQNRSEHIGRLLNNIYKSLLEEETYHIVKKYKNPVINYNKLKKELNKKIKDVLPDVFH